MNHQDVTEAAGRTLRRLAERECWTGVMKVRCSWCKKSLGTKPCPQAQDGQSTDSICGDCQTEFRAGMPGPISREK